MGVRKVNRRQLLPGCPVGAGQLRVALFSALCALAPALCAVATPKVAVTTYHNDNARSGLNPSEWLLTPSNVYPGRFGKLFSHTVDGQVYAQPLVVPNVTLPGRQVHDLVIVATQHNSVYAFDANNNQGTNAYPLWQVNLGPSANCNDIPVTKYGNLYTDIYPEIGVTGTPVIDTGSGTIYVACFTEDKSTGTPVFHQWLHALSLYTGTERSGSPVEITAQAQGNGYDSALGVVTFNPGTQLQRPGLALAGGVVYVTYASHGDEDPYHGWVLAYDAATLNQVAAFCVTPNGSEAGVWMSGAAPAIDGQGALYLATGNDDFQSFNPAAADFPESVLKLWPYGLWLADYFTPYNWSALDALDNDLGSGGVMLLPDGVAGTDHPHLMVTAGKEGTIYLLDRDNLGHFNAGYDNVVQELPSAIGPAFSTPAYFNGRTYYCGDGDVLNAFQVAAGALSTSAVDSTSSTYRFDYPGATPSISSFGTSNGIAWIIENVSGSQSDHGPPGSAVLHAYDALNLSNELYNSNQAGGRDTLDTAVKFSVPTVANGHVYVGTASTISVFGRRF